LPTGIVDFINTPAIRLAVGPIERLGLKRAAKGPRRMIEEDGRVAEVGDFTQFSNPRQLMAYFGLVPGEQSSNTPALPKPSSARAG
jgi:transposase